MIDFGGGDEIRFERSGRAGVVTLTRPQALNALTHAMVLALARALDAWDADDAVDLVIVRAEGRAFCAGGDIAAVYRSRGDPGTATFFADEYRLNARLRRFPKPYVSVIDGIVMGGGFGISCHGSHRVLTEKARFAMPEVSIGFFPDVGGSFVLPRLEGSFGLFLGLTGTRIGAGDALRNGLATHTVRSDELDAVFDRLCGGEPLAQVLRNARADHPASIDEAALLRISRIFSAERLEDLVETLRRAEQAGDEMAAGALAAMRRASPTSLAVTFRALNTGAMLEMDDCMRMEYRIVSRMLAGHDFYEGIRAALIDKDQAPRWRPEALAEVAADDVDAYFAPPPGGDLRL
jgi:enoyl-CoA hydratase/carnithine racemase